MNELMLSSELAVALRVKPETIRRWTREGRIPSINMGHKMIRYEWEAVVTALKKGNNHGSTQVQGEEADVPTTESEGKSPGD